MDSGFVRAVLRIYRRGDHVGIARIFTRAVHEIASAVYTREQCLAWSGPEPDVEHWRKRCELKRPFVAEVGADLAGFLELDPDGHIDCAYVNPDYQRCGVMSGLVRHAVATCFAMNVDTLTVDASICARPLFERMGFAVVEERTAQVRGVGLRNWRMELRRPSA